jgi:hypothetical protein
MRKLLTLVVIVVLVVLGRKGFTYIRKYRHSKRIKIGVEGVSFPRLKLTNLIGEIATSIKLNIGNFSPSKFEIQQISIDVYDQQGNLIAEPQNPLSEPISIAPSQNNIFPLTYLLSAQKLKQIIRNAGGVANVSANYLTTGNYGIPLLLKGFVVAEGLKVDINEKITV